MRDNWKHKTLERGDLIFYSQDDFTDDTWDITLVILKFDEYVTVWSEVWNDGQGNVVVHTDDSDTLLAAINGEYDTVYDLPSYRVCK